MKNPILALLLLFLVPAAGADSLFSQAAAKDGTLIAERSSRFKEGDIITVIVRERIDAATSANTNTKKESDVESKAPTAGNPFLVTPKDDGGLGLIDPAKLPNWEIGAENETKNTGNTKRQSELTTAVTCTVLSVYPNGNLLVEGQRKVSMNREDSTLYLRGILRSRDVSATNTIQSTQIANLEITLSGRGPLWNNQRRGLVTRFLDWVSPF